MATEILNEVQENCPRDLRTIEGILSKKSEMDTFVELNQNKKYYSYYAKPIRNGVLDHSDIAIGFIANTPTTFTLSIDNSNKIDFSLTVDEFSFAFYDNVYPLIASIFKKLSISNLNGSGYIVYANVDSNQRRILSECPFSLGDYQFVSGLILTAEQAQSSSGKKCIEISYLPDSPTKIIDYLEKYTLSPTMKQFMKGCKTDSEFFEMIGRLHYPAYINTIF